VTTNQQTASPNAQMPVNPPSGQWWYEPFRVFQTNLREVDAGMNVEAVLDFIQDFGADTWLINCGGIFSFHPSDLPFQTRNPYLSERVSGDLLGDAITAAHARGVRIVARMDFSKVAMPIAQRHPEWCFVGPDGKWQVYNGLVSVSPSAGYYQEKTFEILDEVLDRYDIDGFFFNMFGFNEVDYSGHYRGVCQNETSRRSFAEYSGGLELPTGPDSQNYNLWRAWTGTVVTDLAARIREHVSRRSPTVALILRRSADVVLHESNNAIDRELWHHLTSESVSALRASRPDVPVMVNCVSFIDMPYRMAGEEPEHFAQYLIQALARGGNPSTYIMGLPGDLPYESISLAREVTRFHERWSEVYQGLQPAADVGLVRPDPLGQSGSRHDESVAEFRGLYSALQESHIAFEVIPLEEIARMADQKDLTQYRELIFPDTGGFDSRTCASLDSFAENGGRIVLTGRSGFSETGDAQLEAMPATRIALSTTDEFDLKSTYIGTRNRPESERFAAPIVPVYGAHHMLELTDESRARQSFFPQAPFGPPEKAYGHRASDVPGYVTSADSRIAILPWTVGRAYYELGLTSIRDHFVEMLTGLDGFEKSLRCVLSDQIEMTVQRRGADAVIHLVNLSGRKRKSFGPVTPVRGGSLVIIRPRGAVVARALVADAPCEVHTEAGDAVISLPEIGRFEVVVVDRHFEEDA